MKFSIGKRLLILAHWVLSMLVCLAFAAHLAFPAVFDDYVGRLNNALGPVLSEVVGIALLALYVLLSIALLCLILRRGKRNREGFITVESSDKGYVRIAVEVIEQMVRRSVNGIDGISDMKIAIDSVHDAIVINVNATIVNGSHVPSITNNMQRLIRSFVEENCGVSVKAVTVSINSVTDPQDGQRRRFGRGKAKPAPYRPEKLPDADEIDLDRGAVSVPERTIDEEPTTVETEDQPQTVDPPKESEPEMPWKQTEVYDFDKPFESEFAKDLAEMRANEQAQAEDEASLQSEDDAQDDVYYRPDEA